MANVLTRGKAEVHINSFMLKFSSNRNVRNVCNVLKTNELESPSIYRILVVTEDEAIRSIILTEDQVKKKHFEKISEYKKLMKIQILKSITQKSINCSKLKKKYWMNLMILDSFKDMLTSLDD